MWNGLKRSQLKKYVMLRKQYELQLPIFSFSFDFYNILVDLFWDMEMGSSIFFSTILSESPNGT